MTWPPATALAAAGRIVRITTGTPGRAAAAALCALAVAAVAQPAAAGTTLGHPGYLVVAGAADSTAGYHWEDGPGPGERSLVWRDGVLTVPAGLALEGFGPRDLAVAVGADLSGTSGGGDLQFADGRYRISAPLLLSDGAVNLFAARGDLEIVGERVRYLPPRHRGEADPRAGYFFLAGMVLLVFVLLRLARRGQRSAGR